MKKFVALTILVGFLVGCSNQAGPSVTTKESSTYPKNKQAFVGAIEQAAKKEGWNSYSPSQYCKTDTQTLYFKQKIKKSELYRYKYQNRHRDKLTTLYAKVHYAQNRIDVKFVDEISMNLGRVGIDSKLNEVLQEFKDAIYLELASCP